MKSKIADRTSLKPEMKIPLNSERKRSTIVLAKGDGFRIYCKGAPEVVVEYCSGVLTAGGEVSEVSDEQKEALLTTQKAYADRALRTLLVCYRDVSADEWAAIRDGEDRDAAVES